MKLLLQIEIGHDLLEIPALLPSVPYALGAVQTAISAGIAATGPDGIDIQVPDTGRIARCHFKLAYAESAERIPVAPAPAPVAGGPADGRPDGD